MSRGVAKSELLCFSDLRVSQEKVSSGFSLVPAVIRSQRNQPTANSERKLAANRENAKKSTGPKTPTGKAFSRRNALKHGLFANNITDFED